VTPDAVLKRYLEIASGDEADPRTLYALLATDADLLSRWVTTLGCRVDGEAIREGLAALGRGHLAAMARAQIWTVVPSPSAARLGVDRWRAVLIAACVGEVLLERTGYAEHEAARLRILLAGSGVQTPQDPLSAELVEFRGVEPGLLVDAHPVLRAFAVAQALENHGRAQAETVAHALFGVDPAQFPDVLVAAERRLNAITSAAGLVFETSDDWFQSLWLQAQLAAFSMVLGRQTDARSLEEFAGRVALALFAHEPRLFLLDGSGRSLSGSAADDLAAVKLPLATSDSAVARALRERRPIEIEESPAVIVSDRQLMRRLGADRIVAVPLVDGDESIGAVVFRSSEEDSTDIPLLMAGYAAELGHWLGQLRRRSELFADAIVEYRARHEKRLREIVHEANNPLSIINNYLHILELRLKDHPETHEQIRLVAAEIRRAASIFRRVTEFPAFEAPTEPVAVRQARPVELNTIARGVVELALAAAEGAGVSVETRLQDEGVAIVSDRDRVTQVLTNLVRNAIEAMAHGGTLTVETSSGVYRAGRPGAEVVVRDTGPGIPDDVLAALYAPKRSRKGGEHAGLGLHITARLVDELEGAIDVRTVKGRGTAFSVFLPSLA
jgi:signal transduction histidine kinase